MAKNGHRTPKQRAAEFRRYARECATAADVLDRRDELESHQLAAKLRAEADIAASTAAALTGEHAENGKRTAKRGRPRKPVAA